MKKEYKKFLIKRICFALLAFGLFAFSFFIFEATYLWYTDIFIVDAILTLIVSLFALWGVVEVVRLIIFVLESKKESLMKNKKTKLKTTTNDKLLTANINLQKERELLRGAKLLLSIESTINELIITYENALHDLGDITIEDIEELYKRRIVSSKKRTQTIKAIEALNMTIEITPKEINMLKAQRQQLLEELNQLNK